MATSSDKVDFSRLRYEIRKHWWWFIASFAAMMAIAAVYMLKNNPEFKFHADIMIEQEEGGGMGGGMMQMMKQFSMGSFGGGSVDDEMAVLQSRSLLCEAINKLGLQYDYKGVDGMRKLSLYRKSPVELSTNVDLDTLQSGATFKINLRSDGKIDVKVKGKWFSTLFKQDGMTLPATVKLPDGAFTIRRTAFYKAGVERKLTVEVNGTAQTYDDYSKIYYADVPSLKSNGITLFYQDEDKQRGKDLLNMVVELYNIRRLREEQTKASREIAFIDDRLASLTSQLSESEKQLEEFKTANDVTDIAAEAKVLLEQTSKNKASIVGLQTQLSIFDMICEFLDDPKNKYSMIPVTSGQDYESAAKSIESYNQLILERTKLDMAAKHDNKALQALNKQIDGMRGGVIETMRKARESAEIAYNDFVREDGKYASRLKQLPSHERRYVDLYRDTEIKNNLYIFLLEQRESNALKFGVQEIGRIIDPAYHEVKKAWPKGSIVFGAALVLAIIIPLLILMLRAIRTKRIMIRQDLEKLTDFEIVGEVADNGQAGMRRVRDRLIASEGVGVVAIACVKSESGTAGIAAALATSFGNALRKAVVVDLCGNSSAAASLDDYIVGKATIDSVVGENAGGFDVIASKGDQSIDLIASEQFAVLVDSLRKNYDYVILAGDAFGDYSAFSVVATMADRMLGCVEAGELRENFTEFDNELKALSLPSGYVFQK